MNSPTMTFRYLYETDPAIRNTADVIILAVHACMVDNGFRMKGGEGEGGANPMFRTAGGGVGTTILPPGWNVGEAYSFVYTNPRFRWAANQQMMHQMQLMGQAGAGRVQGPYGQMAFPPERVIHLKGIKIADKVAIHAVDSLGSAPMITLEISLPEFVHESAFNGLGCVDPTSPIGLRQGKPIPLFDHALKMPEILCRRITQYIIEKLVVLGDPASPLPAPGGMPGVIPPSNLVGGLPSAPGPAGMPGMYGDLMSPSYAGSMGMMPPGMGQPGHGMNMSPPPSAPPRGYGSQQGGRGGRGGSMGGRYGDGGNLMGPNHPAFSSGMEGGMGMQSRGTRFDPYGPMPR